MMPTVGAASGWSAAAGAAAAHGGGCGHRSARSPTRRHPPRRRRGDAPLEALAGLPEGRGRRRRPARRGPARRVHLAGPQVPIRAGRDLDRPHAGGGQREDGDGARRCDAADAVCVVRGEPEVAVRAAGDAHRSGAGNGELRHRPRRCDAGDAMAVVVGEPHLAVRTARDVGRGRSRADAAREFGDGARRSEAADEARLGGAVNQIFPSGPEARSYGPAIGVSPAENSVTAPAGVMRPMPPLAAPANQTFPSGPAAIPVGPVPLPMPPSTIRGGLPRRVRRSGRAGGVDEQARGRDEQRRQREQRRRRCIGGPRAGDCCGPCPAVGADAPDRRNGRRRVAGALSLRTDRRAGSGRASGRWRAP